MTAKLTASSAEKLQQRWQHEQLYCHAGHYYQNILDAIDCAQQSIDIAVYIFDCDQQGMRFIDALDRACRRGVSLRLLIDGIGSASDADVITQRLTAAGGKVQIYHPQPWLLSHYRWSRLRGNHWQKLLFFLRKLNRRDHRKVFIIDNTQAWCGSFNISHNHCSERPPWRDYGVALSGPPLRQLAEEFEQSWRPPESLGPNELTRSWRHWRTFRSNFGYRARRLRNQLLIHSIADSRQRLWIISAYFAPAGDVLRAISHARRRGVDVRIIIAGQSDIEFFPLLTASYYHRLLKRGVKLYRYQQGVLHGKMIISDRHCVLGSTNLNHRSYHHDLELDAVLSHGESLDLACEWFLREQQASVEVDSDDPAVLFGPRYLFGRLLRLFKHWM